MKVKVLSRNPDRYLRETKNDIHKVPRNYDPALHPFEMQREYVRALNAVKLERVFAKPFVGCFDGHCDVVSCIYKHPEQLSWMYSGSADGIVKHWNIPLRKCVRTLQAHEGYVRGMTFSEDSETLIIIGDDKNIRFWNAKPPESAVDGEGDVTPNHSVITKYQLTSITHHAEKNMFATCGDACLLWEGERNEPINKFDWGADTMNCVRFNPSQVNVLGGYASDRSIVLYDIRGGSPIRKVTLSLRLNAMCWNPMEPFVFAAANEDYNSHSHRHNHPPTSSRTGSQLKNFSLSSTTTVGLVPSSNEEQRGLLAVSSLSTDSKSFSSPAGSSGECGISAGVDGSSAAVVGNRESGDRSLLFPEPKSYSSDNNNSRGSGDSNSSSRSGTTSISHKKRGCLSKMLTCRVLVVLLLVKCLILSFIIPAHLIPTSSSEYPPPPDYTDNAISGNGDSHQSTGDEDGFDNNIMLDDQPLSLTLKTEIMNLVEPFDILSQPVTPAEPSEGTDTNGAAPAPDTDGNDGDSTTDDGGNGNANGGGNGNDDGGDDDDDDATTTETPAGEGESNGDTAKEADGDDDGESQVEGGGDATDKSKSDSETAAASSSEATTASEGGGNRGSCSNGDSGDDAEIKTVLEKIEGLMEAVKNIDSSIDKMETLVQSTMIDERVYKCISAISNGNQTQAIKYWKQILRYLSTPQKQAAILNQLIRESYGGTEEHILPVIQFIDQTTQYYGYYTLFKELEKYEHLYKNTAVFTLGHYVKKSCGRDSALYKSLPGAVQSVFAEFFTLQNKHNKGYLYYVKRCVSKHYQSCLDVLTKRIDPYVLDGLGNDSEEKKRYHWRLNATDATVTKFFILNHDKYWTYRLQDLNNSPRFKMEEAGSNAEIELAHFQLKLHTDDEIMIQIRDSEDYLEKEDFKSDKAEVRLHSFHQADGIPDSPRMFWLVNPVSISTDSVDEPDSCNIDLASVISTNGNGNGNSK